MPTRVIIREPYQPPPPSSTRQGVTNNQNIPTGSGGEVRHRQNERSLRAVSFRSSLVPRKLKPGMPSTGQNEHISRSDISASPRLVGYLFMMTASIVILVTTVNLYNNATSDNDELCTPGTLCGKRDDFFVASTWVVLKWKLYASIGIGAGGTGISFFVCLAHFDAFFFPNFWRKVFRDGSKGEMTILIFLVVFWLAGVHICTSVFSAGEVSPNIYFATWLALASAIINLSTWLVGADRRSIAEVLHDYPCGTSYNWWMTFLFSLVGSLSILDGYLEREKLPENFTLNAAEWNEWLEHEWVDLLAITWSITGTCILALLLCYFAHDSHYLVDMRCCKVRVGWREFEVIVLVCLVGLTGYMVFKYTGVDNVLNRISNPYFATWGTFFFSLLTFAAWLEETKETKRVFLVIDKAQTENASTTAEA